MKIKKWVDMGAEVEIQIDVSDIRLALAECFEEINEDRLGEDGPSKSEILRALNQIGAFLRAISDEQIEKLDMAPRLIIKKFLLDQALRYDFAEVNEK